MRAPTSRTAPIRLISRSSSPSESFVRDAIQAISRYHHCARRAKGRAPIRPILASGGAPSYPPRDRTWVQVCSNAPRTGVYRPDGRGAGSGSDLGGDRLRVLLAGPPREGVPGGG